MTWRKKDEAKRYEKIHTVHQDKTKAPQQITGTKTKENITKGREKGNSRCH